MKRSPMLYIDKYACNVYQDVSNINYIKNNKRQDI